MGTQKIVYLTGLVTGVLITLFYVILQNTGGELKSIENSFKEIELQCASAKIDLQDISDTFASSSGCIEDKISELGASYDPEEVALVGLSLYGNPDHPVLNRACHPAMHILGQAKALSSNKELRSDVGKLKGCSVGLLHGYSEAGMLELSKTDLLEKGFEICSSRIEGLDQGYNCAHTYGHFLYSAIDTKTGFTETGELTKHCEKLEKVYTELCVAGIFMDYFTSDVTYKELSDNETNLSAAHLLRPCYVNHKPEITPWCVAVSWEVLYKAALSETKDPGSAYLKFQEKCQELPESEQFHCGMSLAFPIIRTNSSDVEKNIKDCISAGRGNEVVTSGCLSWGGRLLWRNTRNYDLFLEMCTNENNVRRGSCLSHDSMDVEGQLSWDKLADLVS